MGYSPRHVAHEVVPVGRGRPHPRLGRPARACSACSASPGPLGDGGSNDTGPADDTGRTDGGNGGDVCGNGLDDDGDGQVDEQCSCEPGSSQPCTWATRRTPESANACSLDSTAPATLSSALGTSASDRARRPKRSATGSTTTATERPTKGANVPPAPPAGCYTGPDGTAGVGICRPGTEACVIDGTGSRWTECSGEVLPGTELCDGAGVDEDCDGLVDELCACTLGATQSCYSGSAVTRDVGACRSGTQTCEGTAASSMWGACVGEALPSTEVCSGGIDEDCDGLIDCADPDCATMCCSVYSETLPVVPPKARSFLSSTGRGAWTGRPSAPPPRAGKSSSTRWTRPSR